MQKATVEVFATTVHASNSNATDVWRGLGVVESKLGKLRARRACACAPAYSWQAARIEPHLRLSLRNTASPGDVLGSIRRDSPIDTELPRVNPSSLPPAIEKRLWEDAPGPLCALRPVFTQPRGEGAATCRHTREGATPQPCQGPLKGPGL
jgi:hypothetical protein